jgi:hypothetical protein
MLYLMRLMALREQVDLDDIDGNEVPMVAMRTIGISDVRLQEQQVQDQPSSSTMVHPLTQDEEQVPQDNCMDQGGAQEQEGWRRKKYHMHLQPKSAPTFKGIIR